MQGTFLFREVVFLEMGHLPSCLMDPGPQKPMASFRSHGFNRCLAWGKGALWHLALGRLVRTTGRGAIDSVAGQSAPGFQQSDIEELRLVLERSRGPTMSLFSPKELCSLSECPSSALLLFVFGGRVPLLKSVPEEKVRLF